MNRVQVAVSLWILLIIAMILHFNYHVSGIFYGIDVKNKDANGTEPNSLHIIRLIYYHLPILWILILIYFKQRWVKLLLLIISGLYALSHIFHLFGELKHPEFNPSQITLLSITALVAILLSVEHFKLFKQVE